MSYGEEGGTYEEVGKLLADALNVSLAGSKGEISTVRSPGSEENNRKLQHHEVDFAIIQSNAVSQDRFWSYVTPLFREVVVLVVRATSDVRSLEDLSGKPISRWIRRSSVATAPGLAGRSSMFFAMHRRSNRSSAGGAPGAVSGGGGGVMML